MRLCVVTNEKSSLLETNFDNSLYLPGNIPAYLALEKTGRPMLAISSLLSREDYQAVWEESLVIAWQRIQESLAHETSDRPNIIAICGYSIYLTLAQILIFEKALDRCRQELQLEEIYVDAPIVPGDNKYMFWDSLHSSYYCEVTEAWAAENGIPCQLMTCPAPDSPPKSAEQKISATQFVARVKRVLCKGAFFRSLFRRFWGLGPLPILFARMKSHHLVVFCRIASEPEEFPLYCINLAWYLRTIENLLSRFWKNRRLPETFWQDSGYLHVLDPVEARFGWAGRLLVSLFRRHVERIYSDGNSVFRAFTIILKLMKALGLCPALASQGTYVDFGHMGFVADAFRKEQVKVAEVSHGGNTRLFRRAGVPTILTSGLADFFFQWNDACSDEHAEYGIEATKPVFLKTNSLRTTQLLRMGRNAGGSHRQDSRPLILYAPTALSVATFFGSNVAWDIYLPFLRNVLALLNTPRVRTIVSYLKTPEMDRVLDPQSYPNITFEPFAFARLMWQSDYIVVDSLGGSPIYEALVTDRPILLYTATENQVWDEKFMEKLARRVICFFDTETYLAGLEEFVANPEEYVKRTGIKISRDLAEEYFPAVEADRFWKIVEGTLLAQI